MVEDFNSIQKKFMRLKLARNMNLSKKKSIELWNMDGSNRLMMSHLHW